MSETAGNNHLFRGFGGPERFGDQEGGFGSHHHRHHGGPARGEPFGFEHHDPRHHHPWSGDPGEHLMRDHGPGHGSWSGDPGEHRGPGHWPGGPGDHHGPGHFGAPPEPFGFAPDAARGPGGFPPPPPPPVPPGPGFPGFPEFGGFPGGPGGPRGWPRGRGQWGRNARGPVRPVRPAVLALLAESPMHGYQIMQEIRRRTDEEWRPSPGSIYPILQQLEDEGLVRTVENGGRRVAQLTDAGREHIAGREDEFAALWESHTSDGGPDSDRFAALHRQLGDLSSAAGQVAYAGTDAQVTAMGKILADARRRLYALLAEDQDYPED
ncbi:PadR family transcriptional regulator [Amycolatopsis carbonis]|uniref:PadR family transcriptional regulator n=1 Tax=Amycolatopsis carbonis TaxID=715471 RepID=A0A9Y2IDS9_9PSEU|nr:PadR family transcriptional regulator [Amycolatopsis sp. 2-15]WIX77897.1 PadR family transcriptional regulator [Amycolatopsis sp. 2-15]